MTTMDNGSKRMKHVPPWILNRMDDGKEVMKTKNSAPMEWVSTHQHGLAGFILALAERQHKLAAMAL